MKRFTKKINPVLKAFVLFFFILSHVATAAEIYYYHNDHLGTPQVMTDENADIVWKADYTPFGKADVVVETITNNIRFPGQYFDEETGLHYNYFRDYDPELGRYIQSDPIGLAGGINTYGYVGGNPLSNIDPLGLAYSPQGEQGVSRQNALQLPPGDECAKCVGKVLGGTDIAALGVAGATGHYAIKPRKGVAGGGQAGMRTSVWSLGVHEINKRGGKGSATRVVRNVGRGLARFSGPAGLALTAYDIAAITACIKKCKEDKECSVE
jgi:RHS repeat-associated protein